jgi:hypothetical protein
MELVLSAAHTGAAAELVVKKASLVRKFVVERACERSNTDV